MCSWHLIAFLIFPTHVWDIGLLLWLFDAHTVRLRSRYKEHVHPPRNLDGPVRALVLYVKSAITNIGLTISVAEHSIT